MFSEQQVLEVQTMKKAQHKTPTQKGGSNKLYFRCNLRGERIRAVYYFYLSGTHNNKNYAVPE